MSREAIAAVLARDRPRIGRAPGGALACELRRPREPRLAGRAGGVGPRWAEPESLPAGAGAARRARPGRRRRARHRTWPSEHGHPRCSPTPVRGGTARSTSSCSRACSRTAAPAGPSGSYWRRWRRSRMTRDWCATSRPSSSALRPASPTGHTAARGQRCSPSGELELVSGVGGRGNTNVWSVRDPRANGDVLHRPARRRVAPPAGARPLVACVSSNARRVRCNPRRPTRKRAVRIGQLPPGNRPILTGVSEAKGGHDRTVPAENCPVLTGVSVSKGGQDRTLFELGPPETPAETPAKTPAETPAPNARAGREPQNPRTKEDPPSPPDGGSSPDSILVEEAYVTARGRKRRRLVRVDLDEVRRGLGLPGARRSRRLGAHPCRGCAMPSARARSRSGSSRSS